MAESLPLLSPQLSAAAAPAAAPFDPMRFAADHRVHVLYGSMLTTDSPYLIVHPAELAPEKESALRAKIEKAYRQNQPYCFEAPDLQAIITALAGVVPLSRATEQALIAEATQKYLQKVSAAPDAPTADDKPFAAAVASRLSSHKIGVRDSEMLKNGMGLYLLLDKAVTDKGYAGGLSRFVDTHQAVRADQYLAQLQQFTGVDPGAFLKAAHDGGIEKAGQLLGVDPAYVHEIRQLVERLPEHQFAQNAVEGWRFGRAVRGMGQAGIDEKIEAGLKPRIEAQITSLRAAAKGNYAVTPEVAAVEANVAAGLRLLPPELTELMYRLGTEIVYTPAPNLSAVGGGRALGINRHIKQHGDDTDGVYHLFLAGVQGPASAAEVAVHEANHLVMPGFLSQSDIARVDALAQSDSARLTKMASALRQWQTADPSARPALLQQIDRQFSAPGQSLAQLIPNGDLSRLATLVGEAENKLRVDSNWYHRSPYSNKTARFEEINSRYSEMRYVGLRDNPALLQFIVPGLTEVHGQVYLPHIGRALAALRSRQDGVASAPDSKLAAAKQSSIVLPETAKAVDTDVLADREHHGTLFTPERSIPQGGHSFF